MIVRAHTGTALAASLTAFLLVAAPSVAGAQTPATNAPAAPPAAVVTAPAIPAPPASDPYWALIGGYEWDTHGSSYGFFGPHYTHPFGSGNVAWTARVFGNYLRYEFSDTTKTTKVRAPGGSASVGLKFGTTNYFAVSAGPSVSWRKTTVKTNAGAENTTDETRTGVNFGADIYGNPTPKSNIQVLGNFNTADKYSWGRVGAKVDVAPKVAVGGEVIAQGNTDIKSVQFGGLIEVRPASQMSLMFRAGYKRSSFDVGADKTGPYFGINFYKRLN